MNVLCINDKPYSKYSEPWILKVGEVYAVTDVQINFSRTFYELAPQPFYYYDSEFFVPIDPNEEEIAEYSKPETVSA